MIGTPRTIWAIDDAPALTVTDISGANAAFTLPITSQKFQIVEVGYVCTIAQTVAVATITVARVKAQGVSGVTIGTFPIATTTGIGDVVKAYMGDFADSELAAGEWLTFTSDGGGDAGSGWFFAYGNEIEANNSAVATYSEVAKDPAGSGNITGVAGTEA